MVGGTLLTSMLCSTLLLTVATTFSIIMLATLRRMVCVVASVLPSVNVNALSRLINSIVLRLAIWWILFLLA